MSNPKFLNIDSLSLQHILDDESELIPLMTPEDEEEIKKEDVKEIFGAINQLKNNYKVALTLNLIEGYDYEEISDIMKISYQNSRTMISRAKRKLRELLVVNYER